MLSGALALAEREEETAGWFALRFGFSSFGIFAAFEDEGGRQTHLSGKIAETLKEHAPDLPAKPPVIEEVNILGTKLG